MAGKRARTRVASVSRRAHEWVDRQDPDSASGVAIGAWRRYRGVDGPLQSALLAIGGALFFGLGFGRVLQLVHVRAWQVRLPARQTDQALYAAVLVGFYGLILLLLVQLTELRGSPSWVGKVLAIGWVALLVVFFTWVPWLLTHKLIPRRDLLPATALTGFGLVLVMIVSRYVMQYWVDLYARDR